MKCFKTLCRLYWYVQPLQKIVLFIIIPYLENFTDSVSKLTINIQLTVLKYQIDGRKLYPTNWTTFSWAICNNFLAILWIFFLVIGLRKHLTSRNFPLVLYLYTVAATPSPILWLKLTGSQPISYCSKSVCESSH